LPCLWSSFYIFSNSLSLAHAGLVCQTWHTVASSECLWRRHLFHLFPHAERDAKLRFLDYPSPATSSKQLLKVLTTCPSCGKSVYGQEIRVHRQTNLFFYLLQDEHTSCKNEKAEYQMCHNCATQANLTTVLAAKKRVLSLF